MRLLLQYRRINYRDVFLCICQVSSNFKSEALLGKRPKGIIEVVDIFLINISYDINGFLIIIVEIGIRSGQ